MAAGSPSRSSKFPELDRSFQHARALDIVIARYDEPVLEVVTRIAELMALPKLRTLDPNFVVYNKYESNDTFTKALLDKHDTMFKYSAQNLAVRNLTNIGRETDTYLHHIVTHWSNLANHTIFHQAGVHFGPTAYVSWIRDYFVPETGFLSLAPSSYSCSSCDECYDRDWSEDPDLLADVYEDFNQGSKCADIVLTYRGQFIVSAARIRGNNVSTYNRWLDEIRQPQGRLHTTPYTVNPWSRKADSLSAPRVGFTFERLWGTVFQCNEKAIADRCPSLFSSLICPAFACGVSPLRHCQCLDY